MDIMEVFSLFDGRSCLEDVQGYGHEHLETLATNFTSSLEQLQGNGNCSRMLQGLPFHFVAWGLKK